MLALATSVGAGYDAYRAGRTTLFVQREVPGIYGEGQDCCHKPPTRLEEIDVSRWV